jgi:acyl-homoserine-lactone acylase
MDRPSSKVVGVVDPEAAAPARPVARPWGRALVGVLAALILLVGVLPTPGLAAPAGMAPDRGERVAQGPPTGRGPLVYDAEIRRTSFGLPHITADDHGSLGFGLGYAFAEDNLCTFARRLIQVNAQQARFLGATEANVRSDLFHQWLIDSGVVEGLLDGRDGRLAPSSEARALTRGYAAGYSRYLRETGVGQLPDPTCRDADWVREIDETDVLRHQSVSLIRAGLSNFQAAMLAAAPPAVPGATPAPAAAPVPSEDPAAAIAEQQAAGAAGSNAYALGSEATVGGTGMVLGNPHFPWQGHDRFYQLHLTIPGELDVMGASLYGNPIVNIGHTAGVAWSHTVSTAQRFTIYRLTLAPDDPTTYLVDGEPREMVAREVTVEVPGPDGQVTERRHTFYETEYGPVIQTGQLPWSATTAFAVRDVNIDNGRALDTWLDMNRAQSVPELRAALDRWQGIPWVNTIAADTDGRAYYGDHSAVPNVSLQQMASCGSPILDGSRSACAWATDADAAVPGIFGPANLPQLERADYTANMNNSYWLTNPSQPLEGFSPIIGSEGTDIGLRARLGLLLVAQRLAGSDDLEGTGFTLDRLQDVMFNNRNLGAELVRDDLVAACRAQPTVTVGGAEVGLTEACDVLADWDLRVERDSRGAHLYREFAAAGGVRFAVPFDRSDPIGTPNTLDTGDARVLQALGTAVQRLTAATIPLDARWGDVHFVVRDGKRIEIHGGPGGQGIFNVMTSVGLQPNLGYPEILAGGSFIMAAELTEEGPRSRALLAYSQSSDPTSPFFADQTVRYQDKAWIDLPFAEADILADPNLTTTTVRLSQDDCKQSGWRAFERPSFTNQGACVRWFATREGA